MSYAFVHDWIFHIGGAEQVFFDLIREKIAQERKNETAATQEQAMVIYTLFSDRSSITIDTTELPIITALPRWINNIFVWGSTAHILPDLGHYDLITSLPFEDKYPWLLKVKTLLNELNIFLMTGVGWLGDIGVRILRKLLDYRNLIVIYPLLTKMLWAKIQEQQPNELIISSFAAVKNVVPVGKVVQATVTLYLHSPMQYIWENYDEYLAKLSRRQLIIFKPLARKLKKRDSQPRRYDTLYTNSAYTKQCALEHYFSKYSKTPVSPGAIIVNYPKIHEKILATPVTTQVREYYVYVGRLVRFIRETDLVIKLANEIHIPLIVMGSGPDEDWLKSIAGDTVTFIGQVSDIDEKIQIIRQARGLINLTKESCGIATMEALALGVPVLGYNAGATPELVDRNAGLLAPNKDMEQLITTFQEFHTRERERQKIKETFLAKYGVQ